MLAQLMQTMRVTNVSEYFESTEYFDSFIDSFDLIDLNLDSFTFALVIASGDLSCNFSQGIYLQISH